jgi:hypothetical protein
MLTGSGFNSKSWREMHLEGAWPAGSGQTFGLVQDGGARLPTIFAVAAETALAGVHSSGRRPSTLTWCLGRHIQLLYLAKKVANFLHEYHDHHFPRLDLPKLPSDRSKVDVHAMLEPLHIAQLLRRLKVQIPHNR